MGGEDQEAAIHDLDGRDLGVDGKIGPGGPLVGRRVIGLHRREKPSGNPPADDVEDPIHRGAGGAGAEDRQVGPAGPGTGAGRGRGEGEVRAGGEDRSQDERCGEAGPGCEVGLHRRIPFPCSAPGGCDGFAGAGRPFPVSTPDTCPLTDRDVSPIPPNQENDRKVTGRGWTLPARRPCAVPTRSPASVRQPCAVPPVRFRPRRRRTRGPTVPTGWSRTRSCHRE